MLATIPLPLLSSPAPELVRRDVAGRPDSRRLIDSHGRTIRDLRLSITDRCNFRCVYCMDPNVRFATEAARMTVAEMLRVTGACVRLGVERVRVTGGEPTLHPRLIEIIAGIRDLGVTDISMTTNGSLVTPSALASWKDAGLARITFSLDATNSKTFAAVTRSTVEVGRVVGAIRMAIASGLSPVKVNAVVIRGLTDDDVAPLAALARAVGFEMRFFEFMPLDSGRRWDPSLLVPAEEILARASQAGELVPLGRDDPHGTSESYSFRDQPESRIGIIAPVTRPFCGACSRLRITADAKVRACLFSLAETDLMHVLRGERGVLHDDALENAILDAVWTKQAGHGITAPGFVQPARPMSAIGG